MSSKPVIFDTIVIGGGAAGLVAATELERQGASYVVLEARNRWGGRIHTHHEPGLSGPVELGAEFVHGLAPSTLKLVEKYGLALAEIPDTHWQNENGRLAPADFWEPIGHVMEAVTKWVDANPEGDLSFADLLRQSDFSVDDTRLALSFVRGFHAADPEKMSVRALARLEEMSEELQEDRSFRITMGYESLIDGLLKEIPEPKRKLEQVVTQIHWSETGVEVETKREIFRARSAVVTLPLGVLKAEGVRFLPELPGKRKAWAKLEMGSALKIGLKLRSPLWETKAPVAPSHEKEKYNIAYLHDPEGEFPTCWTALPVRLPYVTCWTGGPTASRLSGQSKETLRTHAAKSLAKILSLSVEEIENAIEGEWVHDWEKDPFSLGAYSYAAKDGSEMHAKLAEPVGPLFFAGEATESSGDNATVSGALTTGVRAAREVRERLAGSN